MKLSVKACDNAQPKSKSYKFSDGLALVLVVMPNGSKFWRSRYRFCGNEKTLSLGAYPMIFKIANLQNLLLSECVVFLRTGIVHHLV